MKHVVYMVAEAWDEIEASTLRKSWQKLIPISSSSPSINILDTHDDSYNSCNGDGDNTDTTFSECRSILNELGVQVEDTDVSAWLESDKGMSGCQTFTDDEICQLAMQESSTEPEDDSEEDEVDNNITVSNATAAYMFEQCLEWLEHQQEADVYNKSLFRQLHRLAAHKILHALI